MAVGANSYGDATDVAALSQVWTNNGVFDGTTRPTITQVESFIDQVSGILNVALSGESFEIPITQDDAVLACKSIVSEIVSDMVAAANSSGRFFTEKALNSGHSMMGQVRMEISDWVAGNSQGLQEIGATRENSFIGTLDVEESDVIFQRNQYGKDNA